MRVSTLPLVALALFAVACGGAEDGNVVTEETAAAELSAVSDVVPHGRHFTRGDHDARTMQMHEGGTSPLMTNHGGKIMPTFRAAAIFWGPSWSKATFAGDKITGMDSWYTGYPKSNYAKTVDEYVGTNGQVTEVGSYAGHVVDPSAATGGGSPVAILNEVCKEIKASTVLAPEPSGNSFYAVYSDVKRGNATYCGWHAAGKCGTQLVTFGFFFNMDGDQGCDPQDKSGLHSQGLAALASVTAHELSEARSDPSAPGAWYDAAGNENGDKCAWTFGAPLVTFSNGTKWKLQGEWSNAAFAANTGYPNSSGQHGCISGL